MYEELIDRLKNLATLEIRNAESVINVSAEAAASIKEIAQEAADAIEGLQKSKCPHYIRNVHDRGDDSLCREYHCEVKDLPRWIPVTERLPGIDKEVIVLAYGNMMRIWSLHRLDNETADVCWECEDGTWDDAEVVTHWMPLPQPPKEET